ncbi:hypothetical protein ECTPHS_08026 [Ectothiorhodospira sp. PHS-1]|nr:hypothetical protein ECTPHS_08026 [Ectothiorhodospira sp. PHS-1]
MNRQTLERHQVFIWAIRHDSVMVQACFAKI